MISTTTSMSSPPHGDDDALTPDRASAEFLSLIPRDFARAHLILSGGVRSPGACDEVECLIIAERTDPAAIHNVGVRLGRTVETRLADEEAIAIAIDEAYGGAGPTSETNDSTDQDVEPGDDDLDRLLQQVDRDLLSTQGKGPIIRLVDALLFEALKRGASDVHVQPLDDAVQVRYRLDGVLHTARAMPRHLAGPTISRIKVMGRMDITEKRLPQDGRATVTLGTRAIDLRISTLPTSHGERAVIRLLDNATHLCDFAALGMPEDVAARFLERASRTNGIILLTGPTGSGKTTTLYATLRQIGSSRLNIMTIEDPIEYQLSSMGLAISQSQINPRKGVTFATGLRHLLRQDPDVIMVGEIRDAETARLAIQSSLTGHLVFSTLHTNDAPSAVTRLIDLGVEPYLIGASLSAVMAQRLMRTTHTPCDGNGCAECFGSGYRGRMGVFELMTIDEDVRGLVTDGASLATLRDAARRGGTRLLSEEGRRLVAAGVTTELEVKRVVQGGGS